MKPRVFVSSTYYDLKHVRERLEKFIDNYGFDSVLFENDKVTYEHGKPMDASAYKEAALCHIMVLIIGGRYGSPATNQNLGEELKKYENEYVSITKREFETALQRNIPIFIFVDKNVYSEYNTYKENQDFFENLEQYTNKHTQQGLRFKFAHVDNISIYRFIDALKAKPIKTFEKVEEIENFLQSQLAGMFYLYLDNLQKQNDVAQVLDTVTELNNITMRMNEMITSVGKKILGNENHEYQEVIQRQLDILMDFFADTFYDRIEIEQIDAISFDVRNGESQVSIVAEQLSEIIYDEVLEQELLNINTLNPISRRQVRAEFDTNLKEKVNQIIEEKGINEIQINNIKAYSLKLQFHSKVKPFIKTQKDRQLLVEKMTETIEFMLL